MIGKKTLSEACMYLVFGGLTTVVNVISFLLLRKIGVNIELSTFIAWIISVVFAFVTNRRFVFHSDSSCFVEFIKFFSSRLFSGAVDVLLMHVLSAHVNEALLKILVNVIVVVMNFVLSKVFIFKKKVNYE